MKFADVSNKIPKNGSIAVLGDWHVGQRATSEEAIGRCLEFAGNDNSRIIHVGDFMESRCIDHPYYDAQAADGRFKLVSEQADYVAKLLNPHKKRIIGIFQGNHERDNRVKRVFDASQYVVEKLGIDCVHSCISAKFTVHNDIIYAGHGKGCSAGSKLPDPLQRHIRKCYAVRNFILTQQVSDCVVGVIGHIHQLLVLPPVSEQVLVGKTKERAIQLTPDYYRDMKPVIFPPSQRWYASTGSCLRTRMEDHTTYAEEGGYGPSDMGYIKIIFSKGKVVDVQKVVV